MDTEGYISKKELLETAQISYGQLYRWKRKKIIPESWFIKKAVRSGQETFFPRKEILERIALILSYKEGTSLDALAQLFNPESESVVVDVVQLIHQGYITEEGRMNYEALYGKRDTFDKQDVVAIKLIQDYYLQQQITQKEVLQLIQFIRNHKEVMCREQSAVYLIRHEGGSLVVGSEVEEAIVWEETVTVVLMIHVERMIREMTWLIHQLNEVK